MKLCTYDSGSATAETFLNEFSGTLIIVFSLMVSMSSNLFPFSAILSLENSQKSQGALCGGVGWLLNHLNVVSC
jgi:hypothetical protein